MERRRTILIAQPSPCTREKTPLPFASADSEERVRRSERMQELAQDLSRFSFLAPRFSLLVSRSSFLAPRFSLLASRFSLLVSRSSLLAPRFSFLASRFSLLVSRSSLLVSRFSLLA